MEKSERKISAAQFFVMMFVSRAVITIALNAGFLGGGNMLDAVVSYLLSMALGILLALPVWLLSRKHPDKSVGDAAQAAWGPVGKLVPAAYILYFVAVNGGALGLFQIFLTDTADSDLSPELIMAGILLVALYGAFRGVETVARCAACVFAVLLLGAALVFGIAASRFDPENLEPLFVGGYSQTAQGTLLFLARSSIFADMAVLLPAVKGNKAKGFAWWTVGAGAFVCVLLVLLQGCLGRYAGTQNFPVYALSSMTEIRSMQRLDAVFVGIWLMGLTIKLACDIYACRVCFSSLLGRREPKLSLCATGAAILALAWAMAENRQVQGLLLSTRAMLWCTLCTGALLPLLVWLGSQRRGEKGESRG